MKERQDVFTQWRDIWSSNVEQNEKSENCNFLCCFTYKLSTKSSTDSRIKLTLTAISGWIYSYVTWISCHEPQFIPDPQHLFCESSGFCDVAISTMMSEILVDSTWPSQCHLLQWHLAENFHWRYPEAIYNRPLKPLGRTPGSYDMLRQTSAQHFIQNHLSFQFCGNSADFIYSSESWTLFIQGFHGFNVSGRTSWGTGMFGIPCLIWSPWDLLQSLDIIVRTFSINPFTANESFHLVATKVQLECERSFWTWSVAAKTSLSL